MIRFLSALLLFAFVSAHADPTYPQWWIDRGVVDSQPPAVGTPEYDAWMASNYAPINQGQLLHMADMGIEELNEQLSSIGGAGFTLDDLRDPTKTPEYYAPVAQGQLKFVTAKFMDRFGAIGFGPGSPGWPSGMVLEDTNPDVADHSPNYPWLDDQTPDTLAPVNLGQAKYLFSWDIRLWVHDIDWSSVDADRDGLSDAWEVAYNLSPFDDGSADIANGPAGDPDGDGLTNIQEHNISELMDVVDVVVMSPLLSDSDRDGRSDSTELADGTDPTDYYNLNSEMYRRTPIVELVSGDQQSGEHGEPLNEAVVIKITAVEDGSALVGAPVLIKPEISGTLVKDHLNSTGYNVEAVLYTDDNGCISFDVNP